MCLEGSGSLLTSMVPGMGGAPLSAYGAANVVGGTPVYGTSHLSLTLSPSPVLCTVTLRFYTVCHLINDRY